MKKGEIYTIKVEGIQFPGKAWGMADTPNGPVKVTLPAAVPGQVLSVRIIKKRGKKVQGHPIEVLAPSPLETQAPCPAFGKCGGCTYQNLPYDKQLALKADYVNKLLEDAGIQDFEFEPIVPSPDVFGYRNKMEYSFGDAEKDGPLLLGMHEKGSFYNIVPTADCCLTHPDFGAIQKAVADYFSARGETYFHKRTHQGFLRHLVVRRGAHTGEILINLVTTSQGTLDAAAFVACLKRLPLEGEIKGILHTVNDGVADVVKADSLRILDGEAAIHDSILGLGFEISAFSFFQTNTRGAEALYSVVRDYVGSDACSLLYDLYCGTGTIAQVLAPVAEQVVGIELVEEAVAAANVNAAANGLTNCQFIAGDVLAKVEELEGHPDVIILDPPREGIHPKAIFKIMAFQPKTFVYVSCKATSLARDLPFFVEAGYRVDRVRCVDMFPHGGHVETVALLTKA